MSVVVWHDLECHGYTADLPLWGELAAAHEGAVLDVGAGTGRVSLDLAAAGHAVTALDREPELLAALRARAAVRGLTVATVTADAQSFDLDRRFGLIIVPMQTIQLLDDRRAFLRAAHAHLAPGGLLAAAIADELVAFEPLPDGDDLLPEPDTGERDGWHYASQPVAVRVLGASALIERLRTTTAPDGRRTDERDAIVLARLDPPALAAEGAAAGLTPIPGLRIPPTPDHVGSAVVLLRA